MYWVATQSSNSDMHYLLLQLVHFSHVHVDLSSGDSKSEQTQMSFVQSTKVVVLRIVLSHGNRAKQC